MARQRGRAAPNRTRPGGGPGKVPPPMGAVAAYTTPARGRHWTGATPAIPEIKAWGVPCCCKEPVDTGFLGSARARSTREAQDLLSQAQPTPAQRSEDRISRNAAPAERCPNSHLDEPGSSNRSQALPCPTLASPRNCPSALTVTLMSARPGTPATSPLTPFLPRQACGATPAVTVVAADGAGAPRVPRARVPFSTCHYSEPWGSATTLLTPSWGSGTHCWRGEWGSQSV